MPGVPLLDELMANAWRPMVSETRGGWRYRWTAGVTRRANSALALGTDGNFDDLVARAEVFYRARGVPATIQLTTASALPHAAAYLRARGYRSTARTLVQVADTPDVIDRTRPAAYEIEFTGAPTDEWFHTYWSAEAGCGRRDADRAVYQEVLLVSGLPTAFVAARVGSQTVGVAQLVTEQGWAGVQCMATDPNHRRRGVANALLSALAQEAHRQGARRMYLAAMADNHAATGLYATAGFKTAHEYSYFTASIR